MASLGEATQLAGMVSVGPPLFVIYRMGPMAVPSSQGLQGGRGYYEAALMTRGGLGKHLHFPVCEVVGTGVQGRGRWLRPWALSTSDPGGWLEPRGTARSPASEPLEGATEGTQGGDMGNDETASSVRPSAHPPTRPGPKHSCGVTCRRLFHPED